MRRTPSIAELTSAELEWLQRARNARKARRWEDAFLEFQRLLDSVRSRFDPVAERRLLVEFAELLRESGNPAQAARIVVYLRRGFPPP